MAVITRLLYGWRQDVGTVHRPIGRAFVWGPRPEKLEPWGGMLPALNPAFRGACMVQMQGLGRLVPYQRRKNVVTPFPKLRRPHYRVGGPWAKITPWHPLDWQQEYEVFPAHGGASWGALPADVESARAIELRSAMMPPSKRNPDHPGNNWNEVLDLPFTSPLRPTILEEAKKIRSRGDRGYLTPAQRALVPHAFYVRYRVGELVPGIPRSRLHADHHSCEWFDALLLDMLMLPTVAPSRDPARGILEPLAPRHLGS
jgi:hypothetical protein